MKGISRIGESKNKIPETIFGYLFIYYGAERKLSSLENAQLQVITQQFSPGAHVAFEILYDAQNSNPNLHSSFADIYHKPSGKSLKIITGIIGLYVCSWSCKKKLPNTDSHPGPGEWLGDYPTRHLEWSIWVSNLDHL